VGHQQFSWHAIRTPHTYFMVKDCAVSHPLNKNRKDDHY